MEFKLKTAHTLNNTLAPFKQYIEDLHGAGFDIQTPSNIKCFIRINTIQDLQELSRITQNNIIFDGDNNTLTIYDDYME